MPPFVEPGDLKIPRFTIRELFLLTCVVGLAIPYILSGARKTFLPQYDFSITEDELLGWIHNVDKSAAWHGTATNGGTLQENKAFAIEHAPRIPAMEGIRLGILSKLSEEGWTKSSHGWGSGGLHFHFHKGPSRWRLFVYENECLTYRPKDGRAANTYLVIKVHDSKPDF